MSTIRVSSTTPPNVQSPIYTFLPFNPPPSTIPPSDSTVNILVQQTPAPTLNIFAPKPFRSTASINLETQNNNEKVGIFCSPLFQQQKTKLYIFETKSCSFLTHTRCMTQKIVFKFIFH